MKPTADKKLTMQEVSAITGLPVRTIRSYIHLGLIDRPDGARRGRSSHYTDRHIKQLCDVTHFRQKGVSLERIGKLLERDKPGSAKPDRNEMSSFPLPEAINCTIEFSIEIRPTGILTEDTVRTFSNNVILAYEEFSRGIPSIPMVTVTELPPAADAEPVVEERKTPQNQVTGGNLEHVDKHHGEERH